MIIITIRILAARLNMLTGTPMRLSRTRTIMAMTIIITSTTMATSDKNQSFGNAEKTLKTKADIVAALKASIDYCDATFAKMNDQMGREETDLMGQKSPRLSVPGGWAWPVIADRLAWTWLALP